MEDWPGEVVETPGARSVGVWSDEVLAVPPTQEQAPPQAANGWPGEVVTQGEPSPNRSREAPDEYIGRFADELPRQPNSRMSPDDEATYQGLLRTGSADAITRFLASKGFQAGGNMAALVQARDKALQKGGQVNYGVTYALPDVSALPDTGAVDAFLRGSLDSVTLGGISKAGPFIDAAVDQVTGSENDFTTDWNRRADIYAGLRDYDEEQHPVANIAGVLLGGAVLPAGVERVGVTAGRQVLRAGGTMTQARRAAAIAVRNRMATVGGGYGATHGALSADSPADALSGALVEGTLGTLSGGVLGQIGVRGSGKSVFRPQPDYARLADRLGVDATPATVGGWPAETAQMGLANVPGGMSAVAAGVERENAGLAAAAERVASSVGTPTTPQGAGEAIARGAGVYERMSRAQGRSIFRQRDTLMGGQGAPVSTAHFDRALADMRARFGSSRAMQELNEHPVINRMAGAVDDAAGRDADGFLTLEQATEALSHVRGVLRNLQRNGSATAPIVARVRQLEQALEDDVMNAAAVADQAAGRPAGRGSAVDTQRAADRFWADKRGAERGALKGPLASYADDVTRSPEAVYSALARDMDAKGGNLARLRETWRRLTAHSRRTFAATQIDQLGRAASGQQNAEGSLWAFNSFLTNYDRMAPEARRLVFGTEAAAQLHDIAAYATRLRDLGRALCPPPRFKQRREI